MSNRLLRVESANENRLEYIQGGGVASLFGMPFLGAGLFMFWVLIFGVIPKLFQVPVAVSQLPIVAMAFVTIIGCGALFTYAGALAIFGRTGAIFDKESGVVTTWSSILWWRPSSDYDLGGFTNVAVKRNGGFGGSYSVLLKGPTKAIDVISASPRRRVEQVADEIATFLGLSRTSNSSKSHLVSQ